jgi:hypothetical protein
LRLISKGCKAKLMRLKMAWLRLKQRLWATGRELESLSPRNFYFNSSLKLLKVNFKMKNRLWQLCKLIIKRK